MRGVDDLTTLKKLGRAAFIGIWCAFLLEASFGLLVRFGIIQTLSMPSYAGENVGSRFWLDIDKAVGVWHGPNSSYVHKTRCYRAIYKANSFGARDRERNFESPGRRVAVIGDSLVEGFGVNAGARVTDLLEASTGIEHLNFGCAGFGTTQYALAYENFAGKYAHSSVLVALSPNTDFYDDDIEYGKNVFSNRYRPYYVGEYPDYIVQYYQPVLDSSLNMTAGAKVKGFLREFSYIFTVVSHLRARMAQQAGRRENNAEYSGYYDYSAKEFLRAKYSLERIAAVSKKRGADMYVFTLPKLSDFSRYKRSGQSPLQTELAALSRDLGFEYVDLLTLLYDRESEWARYFFPCDGHFNEYGNKVVEQILQEKFSLYQRKGHEPQRTDLH